MATNESYFYAGSSSHYLSSLYVDNFCEDALLDNYRGAQFFYQKTLENVSADEYSMDTARPLSFIINRNRPGIREHWGDRGNNAESTRTLFQRLHRKYSNSREAKETPYYY